MKYILVLILIGAIVFVAVDSYSKDKLPNQLPYKSSIPVPSPSPSTTPSPTPQMTMIKGGGVLSFYSYSMEVPPGWEWAKEEEPAGEVDLDKLTLTNGGYKITMYQAATGGAACLYPGDPDVEGPSSIFTTFTDVTTQSGNKLRRSGTGGGGFTVCEFQSGSWQQPTRFGHVSVAAPENSTDSMISEIDSILSSLKKE